MGRVSGTVARAAAGLALGEGSSAFLAMPPLGGGRMFRAFDKATGAVVWQTELPAGSSGAPMTYLAGGKQYVVVAVSDRGHEGELVAFALP
jgi:quinoprotein glucose dehydrogenase